MQTETKPDNVDKLLNKIIAEVNIESLPVRYASFWQRAASRLIDMGIILGITYSLQLLAIYYIKKNNVFNADYLISELWPVMTYGLPAMLWVLFYSPLMEYTGGTIGKRIMRIKLVEEETLTTGDFRNYMVRSWVYLVFIALVIPSVLSCLAYFVSDKKQTWHDKLAEVICIRK